MTRQKRLKAYAALPQPTVVPCQAPPDKLCDFQTGAGVNCQEGPSIRLIVLALIVEVWNVENLHAD